MKKKIKVMIKIKKKKKIEMKLIIFLLREILIENILELLQNILLILEDANA